MDIVSQGSAHNKALLFKVLLLSKGMKYVAVIHGRYTVYRHVQLYNKMLKINVKLHYITYIQLFLRYCGELCPKFGDGEIRRRFEVA